MDSSVFFYPVIVNSTLEKIDINSNLHLRKISDAEIATFFGIENRELTKDFFLSKCNLRAEGYFPFGADPTYHVLMDSLPLFSSNYVLVSTKGASDAHTFNLIAKLISPGKSGTYIGFNNKAPSLQIISPNPYFKQGECLTLTKRNEVYSRGLFNKVDRLLDKDRQFSLLRDVFLYSLSGTKIRDETRFLDLMTILEVLFLKDGAEGELKYRLSIRLDKIFQKFYGENPSTIFNVFMNNSTGLYKIRSEIVHRGSTKILTKDFLANLVEIVRKSLLLYIDNPINFKVEKLNNIVLSEK